MSYFFNFTTVIAMLISFFSLMASMYTNIHEQTKEIGILRAIGVHKFWMYRYPSTSTLKKKTDLSNIDRNLWISNT